MRPGDVVWVQQGPAAFGCCILVEAREHGFWHIFWNEQIFLMHEDHMEVLDEDR